MEWTGARYADGPTAEVHIRVAAPPAVVWQVVTDVESMAEMSSELQSVRWTDPAAEPGVGVTFIGASRHPAMGEWSTTSHVVEWNPPHVIRVGRRGCGLPVCHLAVHPRSRR